jgi:hypothetical protein
MLPAQEKPNRQTCHLFSDILCIKVFNNNRYKEKLFHNSRLSEPVAKNLGIQGDSIPNSCLNENLASLIVQGF